MQRHHRLGGSPLPQRERDQTCDTDHETGHDRRMREAQPLPLDQGVHRTGETDGVQRRPDEIDARRPIRGGELPRRQLGREIERDRQRDDVDTEDPPPVQRVDQHSAEQWADDESRSGPSSPGSDRAGLGGPGEAGVDHRKRTGHQEGRADALEAARGDQHPAGGRHGTQHRGHRENREAGPQHLEPAELVGDGARNEDQRAEAEQIAVDHPLLQRQAASEITPDGGQCQVDHRSVEERHERCQHGDRDERFVGVVGATRNSFVGLSGHPAASRPDSRCVRLP